MRIKCKKTEPPIKNLPNGVIDWIEISKFVEDMLNPHFRSEKGWKNIQDAAMTGNFQENSVLVLHILHDDLYGFFYKQQEEKYEVWGRMENYLRTKYCELSEEALSRIIATYHIDDR